MRMMNGQQTDAPILESCQPYFRFRKTLELKVIVCQNAFGVEEVRRIPKAGGDFRLTAKEKMMAATMEPVNLAGSVLNRSYHVCAFFHTKEEQYRVLMPYFKEGFERGDRAFHIVDPNRRLEHLRRLEQEGIDVANAESNGQLEVRSWDQAHVKNGRFDQKQMIETLVDIFSPAKRSPGPLTRGFANMEWAVEDLPGVHDIVEYETRLNHALPEYHDPIVCTYDLSRFNASIVMDIMRTHPMVIIGGILQENPFYVPPNEMLKELAERKSDKN